MSITFHVKQKSGSKQIILKQPYVRKYEQTHLAISKVRDLFNFYCRSKELPKSKLSAKQTDIFNAWVLLKQCSQTLMGYKILFKFLF